MNNTEVKCEESLNLLGVTFEYFFKVLLLYIF